MPVFCTLGKADLFCLGDWGFQPLPPSQGGLGHPCEHFGAKALKRRESMQAKVLTKLKLDHFFFSRMSLLG